MIKALKDSIKVAVHGDMTKVNETTPELFNQILKNPAVGIITRTLVVAGVKVK